jgi:hypothetical protein
MWNQSLENIICRVTVVLTGGFDQRDGTGQGAAIAVQHTLCQHGIALFKFCGLAW